MAAVKETKLCVVCGKAFIPHYGSITCSPECNLVRRRQREKEGHRKEQRQIYSSKSDICPICRGPLPSPCPPNQKVCSPACKKIADENEVDLTQYVLTDQEYEELDITPPTPGIIKCLGYGNPHTFWSPDTTKIRVCARCKYLAENPYSRLEGK